MSATLTAKYLVGLGGSVTSLLAVDPGKRTGLASWHRDCWSVATADLDDVPAMLDRLVPGAALVVCENFSLTGGNRRNDPSMPASQVIGMLRMICYAAQRPLVLLQRNTKRAGHMSLDPAGEMAYGAAHNEHERDAVDLAGYALREIRR